MQGRRAGSGSLRKNLPARAVNLPCQKPEKKMYEVTKASVIKDGKTIKEYDINVRTENLEEVRKDIVHRYVTDSTGDLSVYLKYKDLNQ